MRPCALALPDMELRGLWLRDAGVAYGELQDDGEMPPGELGIGDLRPKDCAVVALHGVMDMVEMYELDLEIAADDIDDTDEACGTTVRRSVGDPREPKSRRRASVLPLT